PSGTVFQTGTTTVTCTAVDGCGNSGSCSFTVTGQQCGGRLTPTATTCGDFTGGTAGDQTGICYRGKSGKISNTSPGVFFYYTQVTSNVNGTFVVKIEQSKNNATFPFFPVSGAGQAIIWTTACAKYSTTVYGVDNPATGVVTFSIPNATIG